MLSKFANLHTHVYVPILLPFPKQAGKPWFLPICSISLLKTLGEKGVITHNEQFLLFSQCFLSVWKTFWHFYHSIKFNPFPNNKILDSPKL